MTSRSRARSFQARQAPLSSSRTMLPFKRLAAGCLVMFFQQFMVRSAMIYYAPTIFGQLGLSGNTTYLLATGVYGSVGTLSTLPAVFLINKVGRRCLLMCGALDMCISLVIVGSVIGTYGSDLTKHGRPGRYCVHKHLRYQLLILVRADCCRRKSSTWAPGPWRWL